MSRADRRAVSQRTLEGMVDIKNPLSEPVRRETAEIGTLDIDSAFPALVKLNAGAASMQHSDISAQREGKTVIVFKAVRLTAEDILASLKTARRSHWT